MFAANFAKHNKTPAYELFKGVLHEYIDSDEASLRKVGVELIAHFPDAYLLENKEKVVSYSFSEYQEVRAAIQPSVRRLMGIDGAFKKRLFSQLVHALIVAEVYEGIHQNSYEIITKFYSQEIKAISHEQIISMVLSDYEFAQRIGSSLYFEQIDLTKLSMQVLITLSKSPVFAVRESLQHFFTTHISKINYELEEALKIFNSDWEDMIQWGCHYFETYIEATNWTSDMLLYACDHTKPEVQAFGRKMITAHFTADKGLPLLLKLQEHPSKDMQFFVTNYLEVYAKNNEAIILKLADYFKTTLFQINASRVSKTRVYAFLEQESIKNKEVALMSINVLSQILGTTVLRDKNQCIDILLAIQEAHPNLEIPILIQSY